MWEKCMHDVVDSQNRESICVCRNSFLLGLSEVIIYDAVYSSMGWNYQTNMADTSQEASVGIQNVDD